MYQSPRFNDEKRLFQEIKSIQFFLYFSCTCTLERKCMYIWTLRSFDPYLRNLITRILTMCSVKLTQSTAMEQKRLNVARTP